MAKRKKGEIFDRQILWLIVTVFLVGLIVGFLFGQKSAFMSKLQGEKGLRPRKVQVAPARKKSFFPPFFFGRAPQVPKIAIVIDDTGNDQHLADLLWSFPEPVTLAILPQLSFSEYYANEGEKHGFEIILHQPLDPIRAVKKEDPGMIHVNMTDEEIVKTFAKNLKSVPTAVAINNHMGSRGTQDYRTVRVVLSELKKRNMFFLDSMTTPFSVVGKEARTAGVPYLQRDIFLDNELESDYIHGQIEELAQMARRNGRAIGIGHCKSNTLHVLRDDIAKLKSQGFKIVPLKELLH